jgi:hypothetical protein
MLVPLIEEGWLDDTITDQVIRRYLEKLVRAEIDTLVLGCTHYPLLKEAIQRFVGPEITLVDSAHNCAAAVKKLLAKEELAADQEQLGKLEVALTDRSDRPSTSACLPRRASPKTHPQLETLGPLSLRAPVGHGARGLLGRRRRLELSAARARPQPRLSLGRGWPARLDGSRVPALLRPRALEWTRPDPQGAALRPLESRRATTART